MAWATTLPDKHQQDILLKQIFTRDQTTHMKKMLANDTEQTYMYAVQ